jgi:hypothetical protein
MHVEPRHQLLDLNAIGRTLIPSDELLVATMGQRLSADDYRFDNLIESIITSRQFLYKRVTPAGMN